MVKKRPRGNQAPEAMNLPLLESSLRAKMMKTRRAEPMNWSKNWLVLVRSGSGYVAKIPAVAVLEGAMVRAPLSYLLMPLM
jgi:hypothetical protein